MKIVWILIYTTVLPTQNIGSPGFDVDNHIIVYQLETDCEINKKYVEMQSKNLLIPHYVDCYPVAIGE